jgi:hypothetical protein
MTAILAALAFATASYAKSSDQTTRVVETSSGKIRAKRQPKAAPPAAPSCNGSEGIKAMSEATNKVTLPVPEIGSLGAHGFVVMMRKARDRQEKILAMQAFCGYDPKGDYGSQEMAAMMGAKRELSPIDASGPSLAEERSAKRNALGFIKGMPDNQKKMVQDLLAREKLATDAMVEHVKSSRTAETREEKQHHAGLAALEKARLNKIQAEVRSLVGADYTSASPFASKATVAHLGADGFLNTTEKAKPADPSAKNWGSFFKG